MYRQIVIISERENDLGVEHITIPLICILASCACKRHLGNGSMAGSWLLSQQSNGFGMELVPKWSSSGNQLPLEPVGLIIIFCD
jgi:hypothetical protein